MNWLIGIITAALVISLAVIWRMRGALAAARARVTALEAATADLEGRVDDRTDHRAVVEAALAGTRIGVAVADRDGRVSPLNRSAADLLSGGRHSGALLETKIRELAATAFKDTTTVEDTLRVHTPLPRSLAVAVDATTDIDWAIVYLDDITERTNVDAARADFVANVSHELKTPLGALALLAETLAGEADPQSRQQLVDRIGEQATRMSRLVDDIMDLSLVDAGTIEPAAVDLTKVVAAAALVVGDAGPAAGIEVNIVPPAEDVIVQGDERQLMSAVSNLLVNAITYTAMAAPPRTVTVRTVTEGSNAVIEVADTGIGIPSKHLPRLFERFYRVDTDRSRQTGGTGLGLAIVRHVALNHGGTVTVESESGVGATFRMLIPRR